MEDRPADCCCAGPYVGPDAASRCPESGTRGAPVEIQTVKALLTEVALTRVSSSTHWFCGDRFCNVVYFDLDGACYRKDDLRVAVWQKEPFGDRTVCYCFG